MSILITDKAYLDLAHQIEVLDLLYDCRDSQKSLSSGV
jgi:ABC-type cobalamin/Fe3+-siderophores transport system ATPase subunit